MKSLAIFLFAGLSFIACGCRSPVAGHAADSSRIEVQMVVLARLIANADQDASLVRFVDLRPTSLDTLRTMCGTRFVVYGVDAMDESSGVLRMRGTGREGVHLVADGISIHGRDARASGFYSHVGSFASFAYRLHFDEGRWMIVTCEFVLAS